MLTLGFGEEELIMPDVILFSVDVPSCCGSWLVETMNTIALHLQKKTEFQYSIAYHEMRSKVV
jgi:hypothetical protein